MNPAGSRLSSNPAQRNVAWLLVIFFGAATGAALLYWFNPASSGFYPICLFYQTTGLQCPGCGSLRAMHQLLHGKWGAAFHLNPLLMVALPAAAGLAARFGLAKVQRRPCPRLIRPAHLWISLVVLVVFSIWRNL
jgi:hypothetical protein